jgi:anhydro-N-acetylmuramic acid kinase
MLKILGLMSGTSSDGLDGACLEFQADGWKPKWERSVQMPNKLRQRVLSFQTPKTQAPIRDWLKLERDLSEWTGSAVTSWLKKIPHRERPDAIAMHGQTLAHFPHDRTTLQLGDPNILAARTGLTILSDFRRGDLANGGQGAPLLPSYHALLFSTLLGLEEFLVVNLGGISNWTWVRSDGSLQSCDAGPANIWIDETVRLMTQGKKQMDLGGHLASLGQPDFQAVERLLKIPYFRKFAPKSTGRDDFPIKLLQQHTKTRRRDLVATATEFVAEALARSLEQESKRVRRPLPPVILAGGGAKNGYLVTLIRLRLDGVPVHTAQSVGVLETSIEAQGFAYLGWRSLLGARLGGSWTGMMHPWAPPARITPGRNWHAVLTKLQDLTSEVLLPSKKPNRRRR